MSIEENRTNSEAAIRDLVDAFVRAIRAKDTDGVMSAFAADVVSFDLGPRCNTRVARRSGRWQELFESYRNAIDCEVRERRITVGDDVAFSHSLNRISGTMKNGRKVNRWLRWTACYRKTDGTWLIVHEHVSVPVDVGHGKAMVDLQP